MPQLHCGPARSGKPLDRTISVVRRQLSYRKPIIPFLSSTFIDFQAERELLVKKVFPRLDALCRERGSYCNPLDLRWGITDNQANNGEILRLCLEYVNQCAPFFLCLIGERYGSHREEDAPPLARNQSEITPDSHWLDQNLLKAAAAGFDWVLHDSFQNASITELEILQAIQITGAEHAFFYFRQPDHVDDLFLDLPEEERRERLSMFQSSSSAAAEKVAALKNRLVKRGHQIKYFRTPEDLGQLVLEDWTKVINTLYPPVELSEVNSERFQEWLAHETYAETRRRCYVKPPYIIELMQDLSDFAESAVNPVEPWQVVTPTRAQRRSKVEVPKVTPSIVAVVGQQGCGKTSLMANWVKEFAEEGSSVMVCKHYVGSSAHSVDVAMIMQRFVYILRREYHPISLSDFLDEQEFAGYHDLCQSFKAALALGPCVLLIDGIDRLAASLGNTAQRVKSLSWLPCPLPPHCRVIISTTEADLTYQVLRERPDVRIQVMPLLESPQSRKLLIQEHLSRHGKSLNASQLERIVQNRLSERVLFLETLANELRIFGEYQDLDCHIDWYLGVHSIRDLWGRIIRRWLADYSWNTDCTPAPDKCQNTELTGWLADSLRLLAVSRHGLSQSEILGVLEYMGYRDKSAVTSFEWALFRSAAQDALFDGPCGLIKIYHQHFRDAVEHALLGAVTPDRPAPCKPDVPVPSAPIGLFELPKKETDRKSFHKHLAKYFLTKDHSTRRTEELPYHLHMCGELQSLAEVLTEPRVFLDMLGDQPTSTKRLDLLSYWSTLGKEGYFADKWLIGMVEDAKEHGLSEESTPRDTGVSRAQEDTEPQLSARKRSTQTEIETQIKIKIDIEAQHDGEHTYPSTPGAASFAVLEGLQVPKDDSASQSSLGDLENEIQVCRPRSKSVNKGEPLKYREKAALYKSVGSFLSELGCFRHSEDLLLDAHNIMKDNFPLTDEEQLFLCHIEECIGNMYLYQLAKDKAHAWYTRALSTINDIKNTCEDLDPNPKFDEIEGRLLDQLGDMESRDKKFESAEEKLHAAAECMEQAHSVPGKASVLRHMGILWMEKGNFEKARPYFTKSIKLRECWFGDSHPAVAEVLNDLAGLLCHPWNQSSADKFEAEKIYRRTLAIRERCLGTDHLLVATTLFHLGKLLMSESNIIQMNESLSLLKRALDIRTTKLGPDHMITRAVLKAIWRLESAIQEKASKGNGRDTRRDGQACTSLSWRDVDLMQMQRKEQERQHRKSTEQRQRADNESAQQQSSPDRTGGDSHKVQRHGNAPQSGRNKPRHGNTSKYTRAERVMPRLRRLPQDDQTRNQEDVEVGRAARSEPSNPVTQGHMISSYVPPENLNQVVQGSETPHSKEGQPLDTRKLSPEPARTELVKGPQTKSNSFRDEQTCKSNLKFSMDNSTPQNSRAQESCDVQTLRSPRHSARQEECLEDYIESFAADIDPKLWRGSGATDTQSMGSYPTGRKLNHFRSQQLPAPRAHSAPVRNKKLLQKRKDCIKPAPHQSHCYIPGPHTLDMHNAFTIRGPNSSMQSLLGPAPCPRNIHSNIHHKSAWYYIPGRSRMTDDQSRRHWWRSAQDRKPPATQLSQPEMPVTAEAPAWPSSPRGRTVVSFGKSSTQVSINSSTVPCFKGVRVD